ncbi:cupin domain-containing protein [Caballeronia sp. LjRoot31]|uniref:cupin domain-containing protein n=1 Tax=Caballeronia sp. LjRoot31 TaxID=3342324 RepID=UPI003ED15A67
MLNAGDSFAFPSNLPHAYYNPGDVVARVIWFNPPQRFDDRRLFPRTASQLRGRTALFGRFAIWRAPYQPER